MGMDLIILPQYNQYADFSHDVIYLDRDSELFDIIENIENKKGKEVQRNGINSFVSRNKSSDKRCYGITIETDYDDIMKGVLASELKEVLTNYKTESWKNKAFIAFLNELPDDLEVWLYWH